MLIALGSVARPTAQPSPEPGSDFRLRAGRSTGIAGTDLTIRFDRVEQDSRCPADVRCVTAGDATIALSVASGRAAARRHTLRTQGDANQAIHDGYRIALVALEPAPVSTRPTRAGEYVVTLRVDRLAR